MIAVIALLLVSAQRICGMDPGLGDDLKVSGYADFGRFFNHHGFDYRDSANPSSEILDKAANLHRLGFHLGIDKRVDEYLGLEMQFTGLLWRPQIFAPTQFYKTSMNFRAELPRAAVTYARNSPATKYRIKAGVFPFKYNPDARNLGEYLYRSQAYPTVIRSSQDWDLFGAPSVRVLGVSGEASHFGGRFTHSLNVFSEQEQPPLYDLTPAYHARITYRGFELGGGLAFSRWVKLGAYPDSSIRQPLMDSLGYSGELKSINLAIHATWDFGNGESRGAKLYGEVAWLGLQNKPRFFQHINERRPLMLGFSLPQWTGIYDRLGLEVEYLNNPYLDQDNIAGGSLSPLPVLSDYSRLPRHHGDDWRWSLLWENSLGASLGFKLRVASDHTRLYDSMDGLPGPIASNGPVLDNWRDYYVLARVEWGRPW